MCVCVSDLIKAVLKKCWEASYYFLKMLENYDQLKNLQPPYRKKVGIILSSDSWENLSTEHPRYRYFNMTS